MKILVTGFDAFGKDTMNPSIEVVKGLPDQMEKADIIKLELPTVFNHSSSIVNDYIETYQPDYVVHIGQAGGRAEITPERVAINLDDARIPDNIGQQPIDETIQENGQDAYFGQLPIKAMVQYIKKAGIPASISNTAGTFVCNHIMYQTLYYTNNLYPHIRSGFIHIPFIPKQVIGRTNVPSMPLETITAGIIAALQAIQDFHNKKDIKIQGGKIH